MSAMHASRSVWHCAGMPESPGGGGGEPSGGGGGVADMEHCIRAEHSALSAQASMSGGPWPVDCRMLAHAVSATHAAPSVWHGSTIAPLHGPGPTLDQQALVSASQWQQPCDRHVPSSKPWFSHTASPLGEPPPVCRRRKVAGFGRSGSGKIEEELAAPHNAASPARVSARAPMGCAPRANARRGSRDWRELVTAGLTLGRSAHGGLLTGSFGPRPAFKSPLDRPQQGQEITETRHITALAAMLARRGGRRGRQPQGAALHCTT